MKVKVKNLNEYPFSQKFRGDMILIGAGESIEMDEEDAVQFLGQFCPPKLDNKGNHDPKFFKKLRIERPDNYVAKDIVANKFVCNACKEQTSSWVELEAHMRLMHSDQLVKDEEYDKFVASQKAKDNGAKAASAGGARA